MFECSHHRAAGSRQYESHRLRHGIRLFHINGVFSSRPRRYNQHSYRVRLFPSTARRREKKKKRKNTDKSNSVPIYEIWYQATRSSTAATVFLAGLLAVSLFALNGCVQTASRLTWSYARDNALLGSSYIGQLHPRHNVPVWALVANSAVIFIIGCIYLGSDTAFHGFVGTGLLLQQISFAVPAALLLYHRRSTKYLAKKRRVRLGFLGWIANALTVGFAVITLVFYCFPTEVPATGSSMSIIFFPCWC